MREFNTVRWLESVDQSTLTPTQYELLRVIAYGTDRDGRNARFTNKQLAAEVGKGTKTANRNVPALIDLGLIDRTSVGNSKTNNYSVYDLARGSDGLCVPRCNRGHEQGTSTGDIDQMSPDPTGDMSPVLTCGMSHPYREISKEISSKGERDTSGVPRERNISDVPPDASRPVGEGQEQSEPALGAVSSSTEIGTSSDVPQPDADASGVAAEPATEGESMKTDKTDPWSNYQPATADEDDYYGAMADAHFASIRRAAPTFQMPANAFVGPETDPATGGPNWDQGPLQRAR